ncbi:MAG: YqgE/AlgH family protein [Kangiellaceae bacterium]|nr:YqgE/AlgH family protein [Kangiellaceae bacterium]
MDTFPSLKNQLLIAMPSLQDADFVRSVTLICEHNEDGAMGIVINHALDISTVDLLDHLEIPCKQSNNHNPVLAGGPVQTDRGFVIHRANKLWKSSIYLDGDVAITTSPDILHAMGRQEVSNEAYVALGYAGWGPGQLEQELIANSWLNTSLDAELLFETDIETRWKKAANSIGFNIEQLSYFSGNA